MATDVVGHITNQFSQLCHDATALVENKGSYGSPRSGRTLTRDRPPQQNYPGCQPMQGNLARRRSAWDLDEWEQRKVDSLIANSNSNYTKPTSSHHELYGVNEHVFQHRMTARRSSSAESHPTSISTLSDDSTCNQHQHQQTAYHNNRSRAISLQPTNRRWQKPAKGRKNRSSSNVRALHEQSELSGRYHDADKYEGEKQESDVLIRIDSVNLSRVESREEDVVGAIEEQWHTVANRFESSFPVQLEVDPKDVLNPEEDPDKTPNFSSQSFIEHEAYDKGQERMKGDHVTINKQVLEKDSALDYHIEKHEDRLTSSFERHSNRHYHKPRFEHMAPPHHQHHHHHHHTTTSRKRNNKGHSKRLFDVYTATISDLIQRLQEGSLTSVQVVATYLKQIDHHNSTLRAITWHRRRGEIMKEAKRCDEIIAAGEADWERFPLLGIPILVKDNMATDEELGMPTTAGSFALLGMPVRKDAFVVKRLREAGALILGKANMSELADYKSANAGPGWSAVGGQTLNVYAPHASPGTSSSGNGVAVAAGFCPASVGTETDGSIILPSLQSSLYGLKPTVGNLSRAGIVPFAPYFDTPGPMAKDVASLAILMDVMSGPDVEDPKSLLIDRMPLGVKYIDSCQDPSFRGIRIGVPRQNWHEIDPWKRPGRDMLVPEISDAFELAISMMSQLGAHVQDPADIPSAVDGTLWECSATSRSLVVAADCNAYLTSYLQGLGGQGGCRSVEDIVEFNEKHADMEMPPGHHGQEVLKRCLTAHPIDSPDYLMAQADMKLVAGKRGLDAVMDKYDLDVLFMIREGHHSAANMVGYPIAAAPIGLLCDNTPFGAFFIGRKNGERMLLRVLAAWETALGARPLPPIAQR